MVYSFIPSVRELATSDALAKKYGAFYEINEFTSPGVYDNPGEVDRIIKEYKASDTDLSKCTMHGAFLGLDIAAMDSILCNRSRELILRSMEIADKLGIYGVVFHTGLIGTLRDKVYRTNWLNEAVAFYSDLCAKFPSITVFMENSFEQEPDILVMLMERMKGVNNFKICLDYAHAVITPTKPEEWFISLAPYIKHFHLNDNDLKDDLHLEVGTGKIDIKEFLDLVKKYDVKADCLLEVTGLDKAEGSLNYMKSLEAN
ncbi:MAG: sugar phosphate isomerase/epimerase [Lachnospiraceae bacterium]|nr:sugar phosphate isomerase/epimerase [Lachnospiraceae bacterium]